MLVCDSARLLAVFKIRVQLGRAARFLNGQLKSGDVKCTQTEAWFPTMLLSSCP